MNPNTPTDTAPAPAVQFVRPRDSASGDLNGELWVINPRQVFDANDRLVRAYPHLFTPLEPDRRPPEIQDTSADPGRKRGQG